MTVRSQAEPGNEGEAEPGNEGDSLLPVHDGLQQSWLTSVAASTRVAPSSGIVNKASTNRVVMDVFDFLPHHILRLDLDRVAAFLPELVVLIFLVTKLVVPQLLKQRLSAFLLHQLQYGGSRERLELTDAFGKLCPNANPMNVIFHDNPREYIDIALRL